MSSPNGRHLRLPRPLLVAVAAVLVLTVSGAGALALRSAHGAQEVVIGVLAPQAGPLTAEGAAALHGVDLAVSEFGVDVSGKTIRIVKEGTDGTPESALEKAKKLVELDGVDVVVGPLSDDEELRLKEYARTAPPTTFISAAGTQDLTLRNAAPNVFRFGPDNAQWQAGLGSYAYHDLGYRRIAVVGEDASFPYAQVGGFMTEFCNAGGHVPQKVWVPADTQDFAAAVAQIPADVDAVYLALDGDDTVSFLAAYDAAGGAAPLVAGTSTLTPSVLAATGPIRDRLLGVPSAGPIAQANEDPAWHKFVADYRQAFADDAVPTMSTYLYYTSMKAALLALEQVDGDLGGDQERFMDALAGLTFYTPTGSVRLDHHNQAISNVFVTVVAVDAEGTLYQKIVRVVPNVNQTLGLSETKFLAQGRFGPDNPACP